MFRPSDRGVGPAYGVRGLQSDAASGRRAPTQGSVRRPLPQSWWRPLSGHRRDLDPGAALMAGLWFDELNVGQVFRHAIRRTLPGTDNILFTAMTHNPAQLHLDEEYMKGTEFGQRIVNSAFTLG